MKDGEVIYKVSAGTFFEIDGDKKEGRKLQAEGGKEYLLNWIREKLRKMESGQIKVFKETGNEKKRDWEQEEMIKKCLWEDLYVNEVPCGHDFIEMENRIKHACPTLTAQVKQQPYRPPSPTCKIS